MKYRQAGLMKSSVGRGWVGVTAELHTHAAGIIVENRTTRDMELAIAVGGATEAVIRCASGNSDQRSRAIPGTVWTCPAGKREDFVESSALTPPILHLFMPPKALESLASDRRYGTDAHAQVRYECGIQEPLIAACGVAIAQELYQESSAGPMLIETIADTIAARLIQSCTGIAIDDPPRSALDTRRLLRVLEAIDAGLEEELSLSYLASVACLSQFHFARAFKASMGVSPHRYVSSRRLERAKEMIVAAAVPLSQIAASLGFSNQANFNRAFKAATGITPTAYKLDMANKT